MELARGPSLDPGQGQVPPEFVDHEQEEEELARKVKRVLDT